MSENGRPHFPFACLGCVTCFGKGITNLLSFYTQTPSILAYYAHKSEGGNMGALPASTAEQGHCPSALVVTAVLPLLLPSRKFVLHLALEEALNKTRHMWAVQKKSSSRGFVWSFLFHSPAFLDCPLTGVLPCISKLPTIPGRIKQVEGVSVFLPGEHGPLHCDCNTIFPL